MMLPMATLVQLQDIATASSKFEACGVVDSEGDVHPIRNASKTPMHCFVFDKREYFDLLKILRAENKKLLCVYHTHPSGNPTPSAADIEFAERFGYPSLIVTKNTFKWVK